MLRFINRSAGKNGLVRHQLRDACKRAIELESLFDFVSCHYFDASKYPNLVELIRSQGAEPREPLEMPYRCKT